MPNPVETYRGRVKFKRTWAAQWESYTGVVPIRCLRGCAPIEQDADILYEFGEIKREDANTFSIEPPRDFRDLYVRIELWDPDDGSVNIPHWYGIVPSYSKTSKGGITDVDTGTQMVQAVGLEHLLDRVDICNAKATDVTAAIITVEWLPPFNVRYRKGNRIKGNRSKELGPDGVYVFDNSADAETWNNRQIVEYLLHYFKPSGPNWVLAGQLDALDGIEEVHQQRGVRSLWDWLNILIDRRRGVGFKLNVPSSTDESTVEIEVFTVVNENVTIGSRTLPANDTQITFTIPGTFPEDHLVEPIEYTKTTAANYDTIEVRGERMLIMTTVAHSDGRITLASKPEERQAYINASEEERAAERYEGVFSRFVPVNGWTLPKPTILGTASNEGLTLECDDEARVTNAVVDAWEGALKLERSLPIKEHVDYVINPPLKRHDVTDRPEFVPIMVFAKTPTDVPGGGKYRLVDRMAEGETGLPNMHVRTLESRAGFEISVSPRHLFAAGVWPKDANGAYQNVVHSPRLDYQTVAATVALRTDRRFKYVKHIETTSQHEGERRMLIEVPGAEYWYAVRGTVVDVEGGALFRINPANRVLRDDSDILKGIAAFASAWHQRERQSVRILIKKVYNFASIGSLLTRIGGQYDEEVNTVLTSVETDFRSSTIEYQSGWGQYDLMGGMLDERKGMASRRANEIEYLADD